MCILRVKKEVILRDITVKQAREIILRDRFKSTKRKDSDLPCIVYSLEEINNAEFN